MPRGAGGCDIMTCLKIEAIPSVRRVKMNCVVVKPGSFRSSSLNHKPDKKYFQRGLITLRLLENSFHNAERF
jgi:hypothetical protein